MLVDNYLDGALDMGKTISVGELRQNPTQMLRDVKRGATYTITDHGEPVATITPQQEPRWVPIEQLNALLREFGADDEWAKEIEAVRRAEDAVDPWEQSE